MKKFWIILSFLFLLPFISLATSGACSSHRGVNCLTTPNSKGNVICTDGWEGSIVTYVDMQECKDKKDACSSLNPAPYMGGCVTEADYDSHKESWDQKIRNQNGQNVLQGLTGSASADLANQRIQQEADVDLSRCRSMIDGWIDAGLRYQACLDAQNQIWAQQTSKKQADEALIKKLEAENEDMTNFTKRYLACIKLSGPNSHPTGTDSCQCDTGYEIKIIGEKPTCEKIVEVPKVEYKPIVASSTPKKIQKKSRPEVVSIPTPKPKEVLIPKENKDSLSTWLTNLEASSTVTIEEKKKNPGFFQRILSFFGIFK